MRKLTAHKVLKVVASCAVAALLFVACKGDEIPTLPPDDTMDDDAGSPSNTGGQPNMQGDSGTGVVDPCLFHHDEGCACEPEGARDTCSVYYFVEGEEEKVACMQGYVYCVEGEWTGCIGVRIVQVPPGEVPPNTVIQDGAPEFGDAGQ